MFIIEKEFQFAAAHQLKGLATDHQCARPHGHNYVAKFTFKKTTLDDVGFVVDYGLMDPIGDWIKGNLDHQDLNFVLDFNPTAERIAKHLYETFSPQFAELTSVTIKETDKTSATYEPFLVQHRTPPFTR